MSILFLTTPVYADPPWAGPDEDYDKVVIVEREVEKVVERVVFTADLSQWFIPWKSQDEVRQYIGKTIVLDSSYDCDNFMFGLRDYALQNRRDIGLLIILRVDQMNRVVSFHGKGFVIIGNRIYEVEPQTGNINPPQGWNAKVD